MNDEPADNAAFDLCVVGSGPAGLAIALASVKRGLSVVLLEAGPKTPAGRRLPPVEVVDPLSHASADIACCQALGGTSWLWGGRCVPFDPIDLSPRAHLADAQWPIGQKDLLPWLQPATDFLGCGQGFTLEKPALTNPDLIETRSLERWSVQPNLTLLHQQALDHPGLRIWTDSEVTEIAIAEGGVSAMTVSGPGGRRMFRAQSYVLAAGGIETTRLLLNAQRDHNHLFGGLDGPLGRFYMGHLSGKIAELKLHDASGINAFDFQLRDGAFVRRRFTIPAAVQQDQRLANIAFWPDNPLFSDPAHLSGALSMVYLGLRLPGLGSRLLPEAVRRAHTASPRLNLAPHLMNAALTPWKTAKDITDIVRQRLAGRPRRPGFLVRNSSNTYALHYHAEHTPNASSRIRLTGSGDHPLLQVDLRFDEADARSILGAHAVLDKALQASGQASLSYRVSERDRLASILAQASDGFHQIGSTRMGNDRRTSVVDANCKVHDLRNLYVASSSVFPSSSQANPTLMTVVLALRLADHLAGAL